MPVVEEITCKSVLTKTGIPSADYVVNPYLGCLHGCRYCYAIFMRRYSGRTEPWGTFACPKVNAPAVLRAELGHKRRGRVMIASVTDAYQPIERQYELTRGCLEALVEADWPVSMLTKSDLVLRDLDLVKRAPSIQVGFTVTTPNDRISRMFEPGAPVSSRRLKALRALSDEGVYGWVFFGPVLPGFSDSPEAIDELFGRLKWAGARQVLVDAINLRWDIWKGTMAWLAREMPQSGRAFRFAKEEPMAYNRELVSLVREMADQHDLAVDVCDRTLERAGLVGEGTSWVDG